MEVICTKRLLLKGCCVCVCVCGRMREIGEQKVKAQLEGTLSNEIRGGVKDGSTRMKPEPKQHLAKKVRSGSADDNGAALPARMILKKKTYRFNISDLFSPV